MMLGYKRLGGVVLGAVALLALLPMAAQAQFIRYSPIFWSFEGRGGVTIPVGDLKDVADPGVTVGAGLAYFLNPRFALRVDGNVDLLKAKDDGPAEAPDITMWHLLGGFEYHVTNPAESRLLLTVNGAAGGVFVDSDSFSFTRGDGSTVLGADFDDTFFAVNGGVRLGLNASRIFSVFAGAGIHVMFGQEEDSLFITELYQVAPFSTMISIPIEGGIRVNVP